MAASRERPDLVGMDPTTSSKRDRDGPPPLSLKDSLTDADGAEAEVDENIAEGGKEGETPTFECAICLQTCMHPVQLPCSHIFCFLCVKGVAIQSKRCALCRQDIPKEFFNNPSLLQRDELLHENTFEGGYQWFYQGVNGWWQYDIRTSLDMEERYKKEEKAFEICIAGILYVIDYENMLQYRRNDPNRRRKIKRDLVSIPDKKGVAGLKYVPSGDVPLVSRDDGDGVETRTCRKSRQNNAGASSVSQTATPYVSSSNSSSHGNSEESSPGTPHNTPQSPANGSPGDETAHVDDDLSVHMGGLNLLDNGLRHRSSQHHQIPKRGRHNQIPRLALIDSPSSSSDSDWE